MLLAWFEIKTIGLCWLDTFILSSLFFFGISISGNEIYEDFFKLLDKYPDLFQLTNHGLFSDMLFATDLVDK